MSVDKAERMQANCRAIWGNGNYDLDCEGDYEGGTWLCFVKQDYGLEYGPLLIMTLPAATPEQAWEELERMLNYGAEKARRKAESAKQPAYASSKPSKSTE
ncbi:hypothetical protein GGR55DRAFT_333716 [Xylaria sp. FL0064]|nr:hypothetical protein GGR55DRAFT_333716 [Xylaria sp. FL0064]